FEAGLRREFTRNLQQLEFRVCRAQVKRITLARGPRTPSERRSRASPARSDGAGTVSNEASTEAEVGRTLIAFTSPRRVEAAPAAPSGRTDRHPSLVLPGRRR